MFEIHHYTRITEDASMLYQYNISTVLIHNQICCKYCKGNTLFVIKPKDICLLNMYQCTGAHLELFVVPSYCSFSFLKYVWHFNFFPLKIISSTKIQGKQLILRCKINVHRDGITVSSSHKSYSIQEPSLFFGSLKRKKEMPTAVLDTTCSALHFDKH